MPHYWNSMMTGDDRLKKFNFIFIILSVFIIAACSENPNIFHFKTKDEALDNYIANQNIQGNIEVITTISNEKLLVAQSIENSYFVGELKETNKGFYAERISDSVQLELGGSWPIITMDGNKYTIFFEKMNKDGFFKMLNSDYYVSIVKEHEKGNVEFLTNVIEDSEVIK